MPKNSPLSLTRLVRTPYVWDYALAPDGQTAAVVWDKSGTMEVYLVRADGTGRPLRVTRSPESKDAPRFSPDGTQLLYGQDYGGDERYDLFVYDRRTRATRNLTPNTPEVINADTAWSPDGRCVAFTGNRDGGFGTYVLPVDGSAPARRVTHHAYSDWEVVWSPDGRFLAVAAQGPAQETWLFIVPAEGDGPPTHLAGPDGPVDARAPRWSPDSRRLAFISHTPGINTLCVYDLASGTLTPETPATHEAGEPAWSPDGQRLAFTWNEDGNVSVGLKDLATGAIGYARVGAGVHAKPQFTADGRSLLVLFSSAQCPNDLWRLDLGRGGRLRGKRQLTHSRPARYTARDFATPRVARWPSDDLTIAGLLFTPRGFRRGRTRAPAVVWVHGGPAWQFKNEWWEQVQYLVSRGCVVLGPNFRGSTGYGRAFLEANRFDLGGGDMRDVLAGADYLLREGYATSGRLGITGTSYGGYLTMTALTKHPAVFAAGSAVVPYINWFTTHEDEREDLRQWDRENFGDPVKDAARYREYSPAFYLDNIIAPVQLIAGANDPRCPAGETEQAAVILRELAVPHEIVIYADEGHAFHKLANRIDAAKRRAQFLLKYL